MRMPRVQIRPATFRCLDHRRANEAESTTRRSHRHDITRPRSVLLEIDQDGDYLFCGGPDCKSVHRTDETYASRFAGCVQRIPIMRPTGTVSQDIFLAVGAAGFPSRCEHSPGSPIAHNVALTWKSATVAGSLERVRWTRKRQAPQMDLRRLALNRAVAAMSRPSKIDLLWLEGLSGAEIEEVTGVKSQPYDSLSRIRSSFNPSRSAMNDDRMCCRPVDVRAGGK